MSEASRAGRDLERRTGRALGGKRSPTSGRIGGADVVLPQDSIFRGLHVEDKARKKLPSFFTLAYQQSQATAPMHAIPAVVVREHGGRALICLDLDEFVQFCRALADMGQGSKVRSLVREARRLLDEIDGCAK